ncbi:hypothetical protein I4U23_027632 [Adineta vaga]|nr:hypothetical protein I4U23_027632 [Adineta vaga]
MDLLIDNITSTTILPPTQPYPIWVGYLSVIISVLFFGSNFVPAAKFPIGDGVSFQFFLCCGIWFTGVIINLILDNPPFYPLVIIGGVLWTTGNVLSMFVIPINGLGLSMLLWGTSNLFIGWASGHFGWFGLKSEGVEVPIFNYLGVSIAVLSGLIFLGIRSQQNQSLEEDNLSSQLINSNSDEKSQLSKQNRMRLLGCLLAIISGVLFGLVFTPSTYIQDHHEKYPLSTKNGLHYVFSMYTGILFASFFYFMIYIIFKKNQPYISIQSIFPAFLSGIMWGIAQAGFILANSILSQAISFPLISIGPGTLAALWSILYLKDIRGKRNYLIFTIGTVIRIIAAILIILSKPISN